MRMSKVASVRSKQMMNYIESDADYDDIAPDCELKQMKEFRDLKWKLNNYKIFMKMKHKA